MPRPTTIKLLQITDTHLLGTRDGLYRGIPSYATLQAVQRHAQHFVDECDGLLLTGDLVQDDAAGYALIHELLHRSPVPVYCLPGNHDLPVDMRRMLADPPFVHDDHVVINGWLIIMLNSWKPRSAAGELGKAQLERLDELLNQHRNLHTLVCLHHHPIAMRSEWLDRVGLHDGDAFRACIERHAQVRGVLWGHVHQELDQYIGSVRYMATPASCSQFLPHSDGFALDNKPPGYRTLALQADGGIQSEVVWLDDASMIHQVA